MLLKAATGGALRATEKDPDIGEALGRNWDVGGTLGCHLEPSGVSDPGVSRPCLQWRQKRGKQGSLVSTQGDVIRKFC